MSSHRPPPPPPRRVDPAVITSVREYHRCGPRKPHWWSTVHVGDRSVCSCGRAWEYREWTEARALNETDLCRGPEPHEFWCITPDMLGQVRTRSGTNWVEVAA